MNALTGAMDSQTVILIAAIAVAVLLIRLLFRVLNVGLGSIVAIAAIVLLLQYGFGISPKQLWYEIIHLPQYLARLLQSLN
jgi:hypothetical protein